MAACNTEFSDYNSSTAPWHEKALGVDWGIGESSYGFDIQSPFSSLK